MRTSDLNLFAGNLKNAECRLLGMLRLVLLTRATQHNIPEDGIFHSHSLENLKSYTI
jgi:hypothetical protein